MPFSLFSRSSSRERPSQQDALPDMNEESQWGKTDRPSSTRWATIHRGDSTASSSMRSITTGLESCSLGSEYSFVDVGDRSESPQLCRNHREHMIGKEGDAMHEGPINYTGGQGCCEEYGPVTRVTTPGLQQSRYRNQSARRARRAKALADAADAAEEASPAHLDVDMSRGLPSRTNFEHHVEAPDASQHNPMLIWDSNIDYGCFAAEDEYDNDDNVSMCAESGSAYGAEDDYVPRAGTPPPQLMRRDTSTNANVWTFLVDEWQAGSPSTPPAQKPTVRFQSDTIFSPNPSRPSPSRSLSSPPRRAPNLIANVPVTPRHKYEPASPEAEKSFAPPAGSLLAVREQRLDSLVAQRKAFEGRLAQYSASGPSEQWRHHGKGTLRAGAEFRREIEEDMSRTVRRQPSRKPADPQKHRVSNSGFPAGFGNGGPSTFPGCYCPEGS